MDYRLLLAHKLTRLSRWMPARLKERFGDELEQALSEHFEEAAARGWISFILAVIRELIQFPALHFRQRFSPGVSVEGGVAMSNRFDAFIAEDHPPTPWGWALVGLFPFLVSWIFWLFRQALSGLAYLHIVTNETQYLAITSHATLVLVILLSAVFVAAWVRSFPAWSYTVIAIYLFFSIYANNISMPGFTLFGYEIGRRILTGLALIPLGVVVVVALFLTRKDPDRPFQEGFQALGQDLSRLTFGLFGLTSFFLRLIFDEVHGEETFLLFVDLFLAACALIYLRARRIVIGVGAIGASQFLVMLVSAIYLAIYWNGRQEYWMPAPDSGWSNLLGTLTCAIPVLAFTLGPWVIHVLNRREKAQSEK